MNVYSLFAMINIFFINRFTISALDAFNIIGDYLKMKSIEHAVVANCERPIENARLIKYLSKQAVVVMSSRAKEIGFLKDTNVHLAVIFDLDCSNTSVDMVVSVLPGMRYFDGSQSWLVLSSQPLKAWPKSWPSLNIASDVYFCVLNNDNCEIFDVYHTGPLIGGSFRAIPAGFWWNNRGMSLVDEKILRAQRRNLSGVVLDCAMVITKTLRRQRFEDYASTPTATHTETFNRFNYALLLLVKDMYNYSYHLIRTKTWGYSHNGTFDGMSGALQRGQVELGCAGVFFRAERAHILDYTAQTWISDSRFMFLETGQRDWWLAYVQPLEAGAWAGWLATGAVAVVAVRLMTRAPRPPHFLYRWTFAAFFVIASYCEQDVHLDHGLAARIAATAVSLPGWLGAQLYGGSLVAGRVHVSRNARDLRTILHGPYKAAVEDLPYNHYHFTTTKDPLALELYQQKIVTPHSYNFMTAAEGMALVRKGGFAFHVDQSAAYPIVRATFTPSELCSLYEVPMFPPQRIAAVVRKGSPYRETITYGIRLMDERGVTSRVRSQWLGSRPPCQGAREPRPLDMLDIAALLLILVTGALLAAIALFIELQYPPKRHFTY